MKKLIVLAFVAILAITPSFALGKLALGTSLGFMTVKTDLMSGLDLSLGILSPAASTYNYLAKLDYNLAKLGDVQPNIALAVISVAGTTTNLIDVTCGVSAPLAPNLSIGADYVLSTSNAGANQFISAVAVSAALALN